jgi:hypothetical protein
MTFEMLLSSASIDPKSVLLLRHQPTDLRLRKELRRLALDEEQALIDYQSSHRPNAERAVSKAKFLASFLADGSGRAIFVGLYQVTGQRWVHPDHWLDNPHLKALVDRGSDFTLDRPEVLWFDQMKVDFHLDWKGKLVIDWPTPDRAWYRWADRNKFEVIAIHEEQALVSRLPDWDKLVFAWDELLGLPRRHRELLESWRGIYLIRDVSDRMAYVGSAYGVDNLLGRWLQYGRSGHGGNKLLLSRDPLNFRFSILQRLPETELASEVVSLEAKWKIRLGTMYPEGLNLN